ncbi:MAG: long-chain-fatty-acid--CoA ligase [Alphaproteobacteria bacterium]|nr:long-chain-fatty-acid--CoA ligase [Alphaproteobacteria bacterium]
MRGMMMDRPLLVAGLIAYAGRYHRDAEIVSRRIERGIHRCNYAEIEGRAKRLVRALERLGVAPGDRVGTLAWNTYRHLELYFAVSGMGAVCHTINPRLFHDQLRYIVNHAEDCVVFVDLSFVPLVETLAAAFKPVRHYIVMTDRAHMPASRLPGLLCYEELIAAEAADYAWPEFDENTASSLCYTSGTTGNPKGSLYSHRSTVLHAFGSCMADSAGISMPDSVCPVVPMFHANAWGVPYAAAMCGAKLVLPGAQLDGKALYELFEAERVTISLGVPTVWLGLLKFLDENKLRLTTLKRTLIGGSAVPLAMVEAFEDRYGVEVLQGWGMTEMSPIGTIGTLKPNLAALPRAVRHRFKVKQGRGIFGVDLKIVDAEGRELPHDGVAMGELLVRGPWVINGYYKDEAASRAAFDEAGWFRTGDVVTIDAEGYVQVVDRRKDVIKSGGEWISSIDVENATMGHPDVAEAAVIGLPHPRWGERPLLVVAAREGRRPEKQDLLRYLAGRLAKWQLPDDVVFVAEIPHTATGKILKTRLRQMYKDHPLPGAE